MEYEKKHNQNILYENNLFSIEEKKRNQVTLDEPMFIKVIFRSLGEELQNLRKFVITYRIIDNSKTAASLKIPPQL